MLKFPQTLALDFPIYLSVIFPWTFVRQMYTKSKNVVLCLLAHGTPSIFLGRILRSEALVYNSYFSQSSRFTAIIRY